MTVNTKKIFITGIAGFIGFHLAMHLHRRGDIVIGCDNFNSYYDPALKRARASLLLKKGISIIEMEISHSVKLNQLIKDNETTHFVHLAAQAGCRNSAAQLEGYLHSNLTGFVHVLEVCKHYPKMKFIFASSSSVYGLNNKVPFAETDPTDQPASLYAATKKADELIAFTYHHLYKIPITGLRFFTVYGPWGRPDMAYFLFTDQILRGQPITLFHEGKMQRDFTYIDDIIEGTIAAIDLGADLEIFNLGNCHPEEINTLIALIEKATEKVAIRHFQPIQAEEVPITYADITKAKKKLNFNPSTSLEKGIAHFLNWFFEYTKM